MANIAKLLVSLGIDAGEYASGLDNAARGTTSFVDKLNSSVAPALTAAFAGGAVAVGAFAATSISAAGDFEAGMNSFASVTGSSITDAGLTLDDFQSKFLELGASTAFSAAQAQQAAIELAKGGVPIIDVMNGATDATLALASAGTIDLATAATIVSKQLGVWANQGVTAANVADVMAQAANASTVDVDELAMGMANVGGVAKLAGASFEDTVQALAMVSPGFSSASDAGTSMKTFLSRLQPTTDDATAAMIDLGLATADGQSKFYDATGSFIGMEAAADLLHGATDGLSEAQISMAFGTIFGSDAIRAAALIAEGGAAGFLATGEAMTAAGTAAEQAAKLNQGFKFALDSLFGSIETLQIIVGGALLPVLTSLINTALIPLVNTITQVSQAVFGSQAAFNGLSPDMQALVVVIKNLIQSFDEGGLIGVLNNLWFIVTGVRGPFNELAPLFEMIGNVVRDNLIPILAGFATILGGVVVVALYSMIAGVLAVVAPIVAAIAVAAAMYAAYQNNFFGIRDAVNSVMQAIKNIITSVATFLQGFWAQHGAQILATATTTWNAIYATVSTLIAGISTVVVFIFNAIAGFITANSAEIGNIIMAAWNLITGIIQAAATIIQGIVNVFVGIITGDWETFAQGCAQITQGLIDGLVAIFNAGGALLQSAINVALELVRGVLNNFAGDAGSLGRNIIDGIINGIKSGVGALVGAVKGAAMAALDAAKGALGIRSPSAVAAHEIGIPFVEGIESGIGSMLGSLARTAGAASGVLAESVNTSAPLFTPADVTGTANSASANAGIGQQFNITAQYSALQEERTLRDDIRMYALLNTPNAG